MDPPSYEEASLHPPVLDTVVSNTAPPPTYSASLASPSTPPPSYIEAVTLPPDLFPVLTPPTFSTPVTSAPQQTTGHIHQSTQISVVERIQTAVLDQPQSIDALGESPAQIRCPYCHQAVTTDVKYMPGKAAWCMCMIFMMVGLICGCCLIPFAVNGMQDVHHSCPQCHEHLHIHAR